MYEENMKLRFSKSDITSLAQRYEFTYGEETLIGLRHDAQKAGYITQGQLELAAHWKSPRITGYIKRNEENYVKEITAWSFSANEERSRIEVLTLLDGVSWPMASVILHLFHQSPYPVLDFRALWSVGLKVPNQYTFSFWWPYVEFCRGAARRNSIDMRTLDRALWQYSKENQKT